jgi:hypothetical protein
VAARAFHPLTSEPEPSGKTDGRRTAPPPIKVERRAGRWDGKKTASCAAAKSPVAIAINSLDDALGDLSFHVRFCIRFAWRHGISARKALRKA